MLIQRRIEFIEDIVKQVNPALFAEVVKGQEGAMRAE